MSLGLVSPILNRGVRSRWLASLPGAGTTKMLTIDSNGDTAFQDIPSASWGSITGTLSSQTDLQNALNAKLSLSGGTMTGAILIPTGTAGAPSIAFTDDTDAGIYRQANAINFSIGGTLRQQFQGDGSIVLSGTDPYLIIGTSLALSRDGNDILAQKRATAAQTFRVYNTFTDASNYERGKIEWSSNVLRIGTEKAGTGSARAVEIQTDGTTRLTIASASPTVTIGTAVGTGILQFGVNTTGDLKVSSASLTQLSINQRGEFGVSSSVDGQWRISGWNATNPILCFQGTTSSFPAIKRNGTAINFRLADDSAACAITASEVSGSGWGVKSAAGMLQLNDGSGSVYAYFGSSTTQLNGQGIFLDTTASAHTWTNSGTRAMVHSPNNNVFEIRNSTNAQTFRVYNTYTDASNYERGKIEWSSNVLRIGTEKAGTGSARALELQTDGTTRLTIGATGAVSTSTAFTVNNAAGIYETGSGRTVAFTSNFSANTPGIGTTSNHDFCVYTNGANERLRIAATGLLTIADASDIAVGTTTGTKIGTATTQKIGFYNKTPVVQPAAVADATDAASVITQLNLLLSRMRDLGLIAT